MTGEDGKLEERHPLAKPAGLLSGRPGDRSIATHCRTARLKFKGGDGAGDGLRTRYLNLGKVALYRVSYSRRTLIHLTRGAAAGILERWPGQRNQSPDRRRWMVR